MLTIEKTSIPDLLILKPNIFEDARGYFFESFNARLFAEHAITSNFIQDNESFSRYGVIRGLHYQVFPHSQAKLVRVAYGKILDVALDIRKNSPTFGRYVAVEISAENKAQFYIPKGFAHGFSVLSDSAIVCYKCDAYYCKEAERGIRFNDPDLKIDWQITGSSVVVSEKDNMLPYFAEADINFDYGCNS
jgi:dTDP-4-dehydrorhamnose 3,5-epimerase